MFDYKNIKIAFFGTDKFATKSLRSINENFTISSVYTQESKQSGRGMAFKTTDVYQEALDIGLKDIIKTPSQLTNDDEYFLKSLKIDFIVVVSYGLILPEFILQVPNYHSLNIHPSSLPRYRGAAPIERSIENNEIDTSVCVIKMNNELDSGDLAFQVSGILISDFKNSIEAMEKLSDIGALSIVECIKLIIDNKDFTFTPQNQSIKMSYAKKVTKKELFISKEIALSLTSIQIMCKIKAFANHGYVKIRFNDIVIKVIDAKVSKSQETDIDLISCDGFVVPIAIQPANKRQMNVKDFFNGLRKQIVPRGTM
jgi:methionyl-tRNA formyltransferase